MKHNTNHHEKNITKNYELLELRAGLHIKGFQVFKKAKILIHLTFTGGEPFVKKDFFEIIDFPKIKILRKKSETSKISKIENVNIILKCSIFLKFRLFRFFPQIFDF